MYFKPIPRLTATVRARFESTYAAMDDGCWLWSGRLMKNGYGMFSIGHHYYTAHRVSFTERYGAIPEGLVLDHLCRVRACVNPDHLEAVTQQVNLQRGKGLPRRTECKNGHPLDSDNLIISRSNRRVCRTCNREYLRNLRAKLRAERV